MKNLLKAKLAHTKVIIVALVAITAILIIGIYSWFQKNPESSFIPQFPLEKKTNIKQLPIDQLPRLLPPDIPLEITKESGIRVVQNYSQIVGNKEQNTYAFLSNKTLEQNFEIYKKFLQDDHWTIVSVVNQTDLKSISAKKTPNYLSVTINLNKQTNQTIVDITIVAPKAVYNKP